MDSKKTRNFSIWALFGPAFLLTTLTLLFIKTAPLLGRPTWLLGLSLCTILSCFVSYLVYRELSTWEQSQKARLLKETKELEKNRFALEETRQLYRTKIESLEEAFTELEGEKDNTLNALQYELTELEERAKDSKSLSDSFQASLKEALDELRHLRHLRFLQEEATRTTPKDLVHQHKQLRDQFSEKSMVLDQTRRRLFQIEGHLHALKQQTALEKLDEPEGEIALIQTLDELDRENRQLYEEITLLEELLTQKIRPTKLKKPKKELEALEFQF